jgi:hypothetical protein
MLPEQEQRNRMLAGRDSVQDVKLVARLPITFRPFINERLANFEELFAFEQTSVDKLLSYLGKLQPNEFDKLFKPIRALEEKMGVERWEFSSRGETLESTSLLAHSPYYQEWRSAVQAVFDKVAKQTRELESSSDRNRDRRLILIILPASLPVNRKTVWKDWPARGRPLLLAPVNSDLAPSSSKILLGDGEAGLFSRAADSPRHSAEDLWVLEVDSALSKVLPARKGQERVPSSIYLSYAELLTFREAFRDHLNWIQKDLADADRVIAALRQTDVTPWCPEELKDQVAAREFVKELFLSGNGSVVFGNSFVQWAANEMFRRARPRIVVARFGMRNKPKPFTSIAILEDQEHSSMLPDSPDLEGSAIDALILARYTWLAASRYEEYKDAVCLCVADAIPAIYAIAPAEHSLFKESGPMTVERIRDLLVEWIG